MSTCNEALLTWKNIRIHVRFINKITKTSNIAHRLILTCLMQLLYMNMQLIYDVTQLIMLTCNLFMLTCNIVMFACNNKGMFLPKNLLKILCSF